MSRSPRTRAPRTAPGERRAQLAEAARSLALDEGLAAVTMRAVAARAGVTPALVAHYADGMDELVAETFGTVVRAEIDEVVTMLAAQPTPVARLGTLLRTLLDGGRDDVTVVWVEAWALGRRNEPLGERVRTEMDAWQAVIHDVVDEGIAEGSFHADDAASVAWQLLGMIDGLNAQALVRWRDAGARGSLIAHAVEGMLGLPRGALAEASAA
ncbi:TetR/AcrR family transcriptional regulator [Agromyces sp. LHK192]|uniref:TetR/AcrR family transcriptional regulator n=1 Tax=Agromyces sp. LHK192 TaxID=2498704 RepID=UPI00196A6910|nr:TetR family transcriptional regulator C-terminal domain-containing protein [Agromyces sp. LHK192]